MIHNHSRAHWFGASDTATIMGNYSTQTFAAWWCVKLGLYERNFSTPAMRAGTAYEHRILDAVGVKKRDRQIRFPLLRLRVNLDGETRHFVYEVKTYKKDEPFKVPKNYWQQCQVEMAATGKMCTIVAYRLTDAEYENYFVPIDKERISIHWIGADAEWVLNEYLPRLLYLGKMLRKKKMPTNDGLEEYKKGNEVKCIRYLFTVLHRAGRKLGVT